MTPEQKAAALLPCLVRCGGNDESQKHFATCPAYYRPAVASALSEARIEGLREAAKLCDKNVWASQAKFAIDAEIAALERGGKE